MQLRDAVGRRETGMREREELSVTAASARGVARLVADAAQGEEVVVTRHHRPVAAVVGVEHLRELDDLAADLRDLALVIARTADDTGRRTSLEPVRASLGRG
jgi:prevent-host-death family protein